MTKLLVTGFGPFGEFTENPSQVLALGCGLPCHILDVTFEAVDEFVAGLSGVEQVLMLGVHGAADRFHLELFGRNQIGRVADTSGKVRFGEIAAGGPRLVRHRLWNPGLTQALQPEPWRYSRSAGSYLCNYLSYKMLTLRPEIQAGFLHIPSFDRVPQPRQEVFLKNLIAALSKTTSRPIR